MWLVVIVLAGFAAVKVAVVIAGSVVLGASVGDPGRLCRAQLGGRL